jgi:penicillin amidase
VALLRQWDGTMARDRPEPLLFAAWLRALVRALFADELGPAFPEWWDDRPLSVERALTVRPAWCDDVTTPATEDCAGRIEAALDAALADLGRRLGGRPGDWRWGTLHRAALTHPLWDRIPLIGRLANLHPAVGGGNDTVDRAAFRSSDEAQPFAAVHGAGFRGVYDLADLARSRFVLAAGQSGHPLSPHYRDFTDLWRSGGGIALTGSADDLQRAGASPLNLIPGDEAAP